MKSDKGLEIQSIWTGAISCNHDERSKIDIYTTQMVDEFGR